MSDSNPAPTNLTADAVVFDRLGNIVRSLHDALREIGADKVLEEAASEFPSARERLVHIGQLTEKAANTVLSRVEEVTPIQDQLVEGARELRAGWDGVEVPEALRALVERTLGFAAQVDTGSHTTRGALSDMMMAQDFQDLTGQVIKKVTTIVHDLEQQLVQMLIDFAPGDLKLEVVDTGLLNGPQINAAAPDIVADQEQVDDLLGSLGF
jgi:chemotaxis protein CheZ